MAERVMVFRACGEHDRDVDGLQGAVPHRPVEMSRVVGLAVLVWAALIVELGFLAVALGWAPGGPVSPLLDVLLWPGSAVVLVLLGAMARRGGLVLGAAGGLLI